MYSFFRFLKYRLRKALQLRRNHHDEFRSINGYSWDYVMVFKVYEENEESTSEQSEFNMKTILAQLAAGGIETRLFYGLLVSYIITYLPITFN